MAQPRYRVEGIAVRDGKSVIASSLLEGTMQDVYLATFTSRGEMTMPGYIPSDDAIDALFLVAEKGGHDGSQT